MTLLIDRWTRFYNPRGTLAPRLGRVPACATIPPLPHDARLRQAPFDHNAEIFGRRGVNNVQIKELRAQGVL